MSSSVSAYPVDTDYFATFDHKDKHGIWHLKNVTLYIKTDLLYFMNIHVIHVIKYDDCNRAAIFFIFLDVISLFYLFIFMIFRHRKHEDGDGGLSCGAACCLGFLVLVVQILLNGVMALVLYWVMKFHSKTIDGTTYYFAWKGSSNYDVKLGFNYHPVLMIAGFIYLSGQGIISGIK